MSGYKSNRIINLQENNIFENSFEEEEIDSQDFCKNDFETESISNNEEEINDNKIFEDPALGIKFNYSQFCKQMKDLEENLKLEESSVKEGKFFFFLILF